MTLVGLNLRDKSTEDCFQTMSVFLLIRGNNILYTWYSMFEEHFFPITLYSRQDITDNFGVVDFFVT